ncbi:hypothetical protein [Escherichia coli]|uniref:hypothetical protein n=1 Tax=Escherichia coli TaxID=562 RepID=UPI001F498C21|nr:hypothetical protein [Escherichia coli]
MKLRKTITSAIIASMVANTMSWAFYVTLINMVMTPRALLQIVGGDKLIIPFC